MPLSHAKSKSVENSPSDFDLLNLNPKLPPRGFGVAEACKLRAILAR